MLSHGHIRFYTSGSHVGFYTLGSHVGFYTLGSTRWVLHVGFYTLGFYDVGFLHVGSTRRHRLTPLISAMGVASVRLWDRDRVGVQVGVRWDHAGISEAIPSRGEPDV